MILALETGWTPDVLTELPAAFRAACHWVLYGRAIAGPEGLPVVQIPAGAPAAARTEAARQSVHVAQLRTLLYPEGPDV